MTSEVHYNQSSKKQNAIYGWIVGIILFIGMLIWLIIPSGGFGSPTVNDLEPVMKSSMKVEEIAGSYYVTITGSARNTSKKTMDYVSITFTLYDANGNVIGTAIDNQTSLGAGETWLYSAFGISTTTRPVSWKSTDVSVICY